jgi:protein-tyrosine phosphatase
MSTDARDRPRQLLFLCTGNYYRSRFAEALFNALAAEAGLRWRADSRGLALSPANVGPISDLALAGLTARGLTPEEPARDPLLATEADLAAADLIVAVSEAEHRPLLARTIPAWVERVAYWRVEDLHLTPADEALAALEGEVRRLIDRLGRASDGRRAEAGGRRRASSGRWRRNRA